MSADNLTISTRNFYEQAKNKLAHSVIIGSFGMLLLAFCSIAAGEVIL